MTEQYVAKIISLAGGEIVGRTKLQKMVYLINRIGESEDFHFSYHHYGPYSPELSGQLDIEKLLEKTVKEEIGHRVSDSAAYSVFRSSLEVKDDNLSGLSKKDASDILEKLNEKSSVVLELAATIHWLRNQEKIDDWKKELRVRKGSKTDFGRMEKAEALLKDLGI